MDDMSKATFHVLYDGPALVSNEMDVRALAPALLALGDVLEEANSAINDGRAKVAVKVRASFKTGCFGIELEVVQSFVKQVSIIFSPDTVATAKNLLEWLGLIAGTGVIVKKGGTGLFALLKWLRGRPVKRVVLLDNGLMRVEVDDEHLDVERQVIELFRQARLRKALEQVLSPLQMEGIDEFAVTDRDQSQRFITVSDHELIYFATPAIEPEILAEEEVELNLQLVNVAFREDNKWRFSDGSNSFYATVQDGNFLRQVRSNEPFASGDILKARLRRTQSLAGDTMKSEYVLLEVIEHRRAGAQIPITFDVEVKETPGGESVQDKPAPPRRLMLRRPR